MTAVRRFGIVVALTGLCASVAWAADGENGAAMAPAPVPDWRQPLPGAAFVTTSDPAVPGATEVLEDTPNALAWSRHQRGAVGGWGYRLFPDGSAVVLPEAPRAEPAYLLSCTRAEACEISDGADLVERVPATGAARPGLPEAIDGRALANYLARWVLAGTGTPPPAPELPAQEPPAPEAPAARRDSAAAPRAPVVRAPRQAARPASPPAAVSAASAAPGPMTLAERYALSCTLGGGLTPRYTDHEGGKDHTGKLRISLGCSARVSDRLSLRVSLVHYPVPGQEAPWDPDFTYAVTYRVNDTVSLSYSSYTARFSGEGADTVSSLLEGSLRLALNLPRVPLGEGRGLSCTLGIGLPDPTEASATLGCSLPVTDKLRVGLTGYAYAAGEQEPWNPDFSYTASYRISDRVVLDYSNYGANRFPWNPADPKGKGVLGGSLGLSWQLAF